MRVRSIREEYPEVEVYRAVSQTVYRSAMLTGLSLALVASLIVFVGFGSTLLTVVFGVTALFFAYAYRAGLPDLADVAWLPLFVPSEDDRETMILVDVSVQNLRDWWVELPVGFMLFQLYNEFVIVVLLVLLSNPEKVTAVLDKLRLVVENIDVPLTTEVRGLLFLLLFGVLLFLVFASVMRTLFAQSLRRMLRRRVGDVDIIEEQIDSR